MLYFCSRRITNAVYTIHKAETICKTTKSNFQTHLYFQAKEIHLVKLSWQGTRLTTSASHAHLISVHPFPAKLDFNFNAGYEKPAPGLCSTFSLQQLQAFSQLIGAPNPSPSLLAVGLGYILRVLVHGGSASQSLQRGLSQEVTCSSQAAPRTNHLGPDLGLICDLEQGL